MKQLLPHRNYWPFLSALPKVWDETEFYLKLYFGSKEWPVQSNEHTASKNSHFPFEEINLLAFSSLLQQRLKSHGRKSMPPYLLVTEQSIYKSQVKRKTGQRDESVFLKTWPVWETFGTCILPTASALGWQTLPGRQENPVTFWDLTVLSGKLSRTWLWAQAVVHNPLNCLSINTLPGTVSAHAR